MNATTSPKQTKITNISSYRFVQIDELQDLRSELKLLCKRLQLKGTILIAHEGINLFIAGDEPNIDAFIVELRRDPRFSDMEFKRSRSDYQPFNRMLVRIKQEIIAFGVDGIAPQKRTSPKLSARELKQWLDEGRPVTLLDVRNDYEVELGTFKDALPIGVDHFREFPAAVHELSDELKEQPIVMFCTGGIRCEKAGPYMEREGFQQIFQLDGGILKYFEECGEAHYDGDCFVFDQRVTVDPNLTETDTTQCFACQASLSAEDQQSPKYLAGEHCSYCYTPPAVVMSEQLQQRATALAEFINPLPGSEPYINYRPMNVPERCDNFPLIDFLNLIHPHMGREYWQQECDEQRITREQEVVGATTTIRAGQRLEHVLPGTIEPDVDANIRFLYEDSAIIVIEKSAPLPMHPCGRFNRNTLTYILDRVYAPLHPRPAHRLDANTSGVVVLTKTRKLASRLQPQFERGEVDKVYLARVYGYPANDIFACDAAITSGPSQAGGREISPSGLPAHTDFETVQRFDDGTALVIARPRTGRTNQIRVHLWHLGLPICGDTIYLADGKRGELQTRDVNAEPLCLHAHQIAFAHPQTGERLTFESPQPTWAKPST
ncbi:MAG: UPF0176 protein [Pirellulaceae bacterium]|jgi:UPF0176 protein